MCTWNGTTRAGIFKKSMGARNREGIGLSYRPARLHRLAEFIPWNQIRGPINIKKYGLWIEGRMQGRDITLTPRLRLEYGTTFSSFSCNATIIDSPRLPYNKN
jgi:hypothetical protein